MFLRRLRYPVLIASVIAAIISSVYYISSNSNGKQKEGAAPLTAPISTLLPVTENPASPSQPKSIEEAEAKPITESQADVLVQEEASPPAEPTAAQAAPVTVPVSVKDAVYQPNPRQQGVSIPVLNYHGVTIQPGNRAVINPEKLNEQMNYLYEQGYTTLSLREFIAIWEGKAAPPTKPVLLTFDDGYKDNYTEAMPILKKYGFRATLFMSPGMVEDGYYLTWEEAKEMQQNGWDIQPHGMTHPHLPKLNAQKQAYEIGEAKRQLEEQLGITADVFCYPYGERNETTLKLLQEYGFRYAFTIDQGRTKQDQHPLLLKRLFVDGEQDLKRFIALLHRK